MPRFAFEKFPGADTTLTTHMKSVGEAMAIGRNFPEALQKALRSLESNHGSVRLERRSPRRRGGLLRDCGTPHDGQARHHPPGAAGRGQPGRCHRVTGIDPWFIEQIQHINHIADQVAAAPALDAGRS